MLAPLICISSLNHPTVGFPTPILVEAEAQRSVTCFRSSGCLEAEPEFNPRSVLFTISTVTSENFYRNTANAFVFPIV